MPGFDRRGTGGGSVAPPRGKVRRGRRTDEGTGRVQRKLVVTRRGIGKANLTASSPGDGYPVLAVEDALYEFAQAR